MDIRSRQPSGRVPDRPRKPRHLGKAAGTREGIAGRPDRPFDGYPCLGSLALASGPDPADEQTLALVGVCVNRIGKVGFSNEHQNDNSSFREVYGKGIVDSLSHFSWETLNYKDPLV